MLIKELSKYTTILDEIDTNIIEEEIKTKGITGFLDKQLIYLDCSRVINNMRMMQTIGYPYQREVSKYLYGLNTIEDDEIKEDYKQRLLDRHACNLKFEEENPPILYKKNNKSKSNSDDKLPRRKKSTMKSEKPLTNAEKLKKLTANFGPLTFKIKPFKKD